MVFSCFWLFLEDPGLDPVCVCWVGFCFGGVVGFGCGSNLKCFSWLTRLSVFKKSCSLGCLVWCSCPCSFPLCCGVLSVPVSVSWVFVFELFCFSVLVVWGSFLSGCCGCRVVVFVIWRCLFGYSLCHKFLSCFLLFRKRVRIPFLCF